MLNLKNIKPEYDYIIIGAGSAGLTVAVGLTKLKKNVLVVSKNIGGDCTHNGCVPSKRLLHIAKEYDLAKKYGSSNTKLAGLKKSALKNVREKIDEILEEEGKLIQNLNVNLVEATAEFVNDREIKVTNSDGEKLVRFKKCIVASGSRPKKLIFDGYHPKMLVTNEDIFELEELPESIAIVGGGAIGVEMATAFAKFDIPTTLLVRSKILPKSAPGSVEVVRKALENLGVEIIEGAKKIKLDAKSGKFVIQNSKNKILKEFDKPECVLSAIGRSPMLVSGLKDAGVVFDDVGILVNKSFQTSKKHIFAIGDVIGQDQFTHAANNHGRFFVTKTILPITTRKEPLVPYIYFTDPPIAEVGTLKEDDFIKKYEIGFKNSDRAKLDDTQNLHGEVFVNMLNGRIVGASLVGDFAQSAINFFTLAITKKVTVFSLNNFVVPYPTVFNAITGLYAAFLSDFLANLKPNIFKLIKKNSTRIIAGIAWLIIAILLLSLWNSIDRDPARLIEILFSLFNSPLGILLFVLAYALRGVIGFSATILSVLGGALYGFWLGLAMVVFSSNLSSTINYFLARTVFGSRNSEKSISDTDKRKLKAGGIKEFLRKNAFEAVLTLRLSFFPYDPLSFLAGGLKVGYIPFILATIVGSIPGTIAIVAFGASLENLQDFQNFQLNPWYLALGFGLMVLSIGVGRVVKRKAN